MKLDSTFSIWQILILAAVIQGMTLFVFLISNKSSNRKANIFLAFHVFFATIDLALEVFYSTPFAVKFPYFIGIIDPVLFVYGPLLFLYAYFLIYPQRTFRWNMILHFVPAILIVLIYIPTIYVQNTETKLLAEGILLDASTDNNLIINFIIRDIIWLISCVYEIIYIIVTVLLLKKYGRDIKNIYSFIDKINLKWLRNLATFMGIITTISLLMGLLVYFEFIYFETSVPIILLSFSILIYIIGYKGLKQPLLFSQKESLEFQNQQEQFTLVENTEKYIKSKLPEEKAEEHLNNLLYLMETKKLYTNENLKLRDIADDLSISTHHLSQVINEKLDKNFYDFINSYRVEAARKMLIDSKYQHLTILGIAFEVGFNSKSSFYNTFKKYFNVSPTQYKKSNSKKQ